MFQNTSSGGRRRADQGVRGRLITGASSGLGLAAAKRFAMSGAELVLLCRDRQKGETAVREIQAVMPNASAELMICDLASLDDIGNFVHEFKRTRAKLDILYNNAAVMKLQRTVTGDGLEMMFQTNYLAPFILTTSLLDVLQRSPSARIINIAAPPPKMRLDFDDLQSVKNYSAYRSFFQTKLCLLLSTIELSRRLAGTSITVNATDPGPGAFKSSLSREAPRPFVWLQKLLAADADTPAQNVVFLAVADELRAVTGQLFLGRRVKPLTAYWRDQAIGERLWFATRSLVDGRPASTARIDACRAGRAVTCAWPDGTWPHGFPLTEGGMDEIQAHFEMRPNRQGGSPVSKGEANL